MYTVSRQDLESPAWSRVLLHKVRAYTIVRKTAAAADLGVLAFEVRKNGGAKIGK